MIFKTVIKHISLRITIVSLVLLWPFTAITHEAKSSATYLANEGLMVEAGEHKVLFDPFFHNNYGTYQLVPNAILAAIMSNTAPYNNIDAIFVSHSHGDHFAADDMLKYLQKYSSVKLIAPAQALEKMAQLSGFDTIQNQLTSIELEYGDQPVSMVVDGIQIEAVRIPHAGWPGRADISNIVFRVSLPDAESNSTFVHMGDADPQDEHYRPYSDFWQLEKPDIAFPPYWFFLTLQGNYILDTDINATKNIGVHVPLKIPPSLKSSGKTYFSIPGEKAEVAHTHP
jgi:L-ascorbate metabolism protein UlaG (beta-lactamase superfamily)